MATTRIMPLHTGKSHTESQAVSDIIDYVANPQKTDNGKLIAGFQKAVKSSIGIIIHLNTILSCRFQQWNNLILLMKKYDYADFLA